ncbi:Histone-binding protein RBBP4, N-terminal [Dillenia turbinata]|uniref:Histone-binding protein RBBP4, N-terminal n=1 Tax=Dillenia turbinata TaxID=194707 RepID=A0AAN8YXH6_9MAGN
MAPEENQGLDQVEEEFLVWKKNSPFLYDLIISQPLEWPSLTVQWVPSQSVSSVGSFSVHKLILGTYTSDDYPNFLMIADAHLPKNDALPSNFDDPDIPEASSKTLVEFVKQIRVDGEVNRARCMPQNSSLVVAKTSGCEVYVFDCEKHPLKEQESAFNPDLRLKGHEKEGFGLSWSSFKEGYLLSGSNDRKVCLWDVSGMSEDNKVLEAMRVFEVIWGVPVLDIWDMRMLLNVSWHLKNENVFGSVGDDRRLIIWDLRSNKPSHSVLAHEKEFCRILHMYSQIIVLTENAVLLFVMMKEVKCTLMVCQPHHVRPTHEWVDICPAFQNVNYLSFNPFYEWVLATASSDTTVVLFDIGKPAEPLHLLGSHREEVFQVEWDPNHETVLASSADDRRLMVWDLSRIGDEQIDAAEDADDGPPELFFTHGGHRAKISDFSWNKNAPWVISSVAEDNTLQIWQIAESIYDDVDGILADDD